MPIRRRVFYDFGVVYDEALAQRIRDLAVETPKLTEKKMFGGLAFLVGGNMAIAASGQGGILVRVDPKQSSAWVARTPAELMVMRGRPMEEWLRAASEGCTDQGVARLLGEPRFGLRSVAASEIARQRLAVDHDRELAANMT